MHFFFSGPRIMGIRPGIVLSSRDLQRFFRGSQPATEVEGCFVYVLSGVPGYAKIGVTKDPRARMSALQTGSPHRLKFAALWATPDSGLDIEARSHEILSPTNAAGEWFRCSISVAISAVERASRELGVPVLSVSMELADTILAEARNAPPSPRADLRPRRRWWKFFLISMGALVFLRVLTWVLR